MKPAPARLREDDVLRYFCPDCGRALVTVHPNGTFDLAGHASADVRLTANLETGEQETLIVGGVCHQHRSKWRARFDWLRGKA